MPHRQEELRTVWSGIDESDCVQFCKELQDAGIYLGVPGLLVHFDPFALIDHLTLQPTVETAGLTLSRG
jgi:hypothetical protein